MDDLLTTKELQELLKIDRTTVYRMLKDGRLTGIKIGEQWRFSRKEVTGLLVGSPSEPTAPASSRTPPVSALPIHCIQRIQNVVADVAGISMITVAPSGEPLSEMSNCSRFCQLIQSRESGRRACIAVWAKLAQQPESAPQFATCHAGLQSARSWIELDDQLEAMLVAGQFYTGPPAAAEESEHIRRLAETHGLRRLPCSIQRRGSLHGRRPHTCP
jgi:excisionase family DNA binding protein